MIKKKKPAHLVVLEKMEAHFENLKEIGFDAQKGKNLKVVRSVYMIQFSSEILREMIIPKGAISRVITRLLRIRDYEVGDRKAIIMPALYDPLCETVENLERRR